MRLIMNNPFEYVPDAACEEAFRKLTERIEALKGSDVAADADLCRELAEGKMLGVLIAEDAEGVRHAFYAFSGQLGDSGFHHPWFVGPVFDYLQPDGYFKTKEAYISRQNVEIARFEAGELTRVITEYEHAEKSLDAQVADYKEKCRIAKLERQAKRDAGVADEAELAAMIRQSQFEKAELHRLKKRTAAELAPYAIRLNEARSHLDAMKEKRRADSEALQGWLFDNFRVLNARGEYRSLSEIFATTALKVPPSGAGECCAPKLLQAAYLRGLTPVAMAEYWYGAPKGGEVRRHGEHYPACRGKCLPVLGWMLQGLEIEPPLSEECRSSTVKDPEILFENRWFCVVDKPSGMLSVPGKGSAVSVQRWLEERYGAEREVKVVHRLDQDTSGLLLAAFGPEAFRLMQKMFAIRKVRKTYVAELEGDFELRGIAREGRIELPLSADWLDRPRQRVDLAEGKEAVTDYEFVGVSEGRSRVVFHPLTGRTHQLRVHSASEVGLGMPIAGDRLYGKHGGHGADRLMLHAYRIEFTFPIDGEHYCLEATLAF
ncbi:MAG: RluA family pseudouridine synthase [Muribaculaceae bacterium]|nr:RluA family pseudouridine synthase [Muribaculaceae bacterium]